MICLVDKTKALYVGNRLTMHNLAQEYMIRTNAYEEMNDGQCPLDDNLRALQTLLNYLLQTIGLTEKNNVNSYIRNWIT